MSVHDAGEPGPALVLGSMGALFALVAVFSTGDTIGRWLRYRKVKRLRERYPEEPWRHRPEWASGRITVSLGKDVREAMRSAALVNLFVWPAVALFTGEGTELEVAHVLPASFALIGIVLALRAAYLVVRHLKFGRTVFDMDTRPGQVGGVLRGIVLTGVQTHLVTEDGFCIRLTCFRKAVGRKNSAGSRRGQLTDLWHSEKRVRGVAYVNQDKQCLGIPVRFDIPDGLLASTPSAEGNGIVWRLDIKARVQGVNYRKEIEVPIFDVPAVGDGQELPSAEHDPYLAQAIKLSTA
jgi:hypothetical protein